MRERIQRTGPEHDRCLKEKEPVYYSLFEQRRRDARAALDEHGAYAVRRQPPQRRPQCFINTYIHARGGHRLTTLGVGPARDDRRWHEARPTYHARAERRPECGVEDD